MLTESLVAFPKYIYYVYLEHIKSVWKHSYLMFLNAKLYSELSAMNFTLYQNFSFHLKRKKGSYGLQYFIYI